MVERQAGDDTPAGRPGAAAAAGGPARRPVGRHCRSQADERQARIQAPAPATASSTQARSGSSAVGHRPPVAGQGIEEVGVVARGRDERVVAMVDDHEVAVADRDDPVARAVALVDPLDRPAFGPAELVEVRLLEDRLPGRSSTSCLWGGQPDQLPDGVNTSQISSRSAGKPGIMMLLTWRVQLPAPRSSICDVRSGPTTIGSAAIPVRPVSGAWARATTARRPGSGRPMIRAACPPGCRRSRAGHRRPTARPGRAKLAPVVEGDLDPTAGDRDQGGLLLGRIEQRLLALGQRERPERQVPPAGRAGVVATSPVGAGPEVERLGGQAGRQLGGVDLHAGFVRGWSSRKGLQWGAREGLTRSSGEQLIDLVGRTAWRCCTSAARPRSRRRHCPVGGPPGGRGRARGRPQNAAVSASPAPRPQVTSTAIPGSALVNPALISDTPASPCLSTVSLSLASIASGLIAGCGELGVAADQHVAQPGGLFDQGRVVGGLGPQGRPPVEIEDRPRHRHDAGDGRPGGQRGCRGLRPRAGSADSSVAETITSGASSSASRGMSDRVSACRAGDPVGRT